MPQTIGHGSVFKLTIASALTTVAGVTSISFGSDKIDAVNNTDMLTPGTTHSYIPGMESPGDISLKLNVIPGDTSQAALFTLKGVTVPMEVIYPAAVSTRTFSGFITSVDEDIPDDKLPTYTAKIQITTPVVRT